MPVFTIQACKAFISIRYRLDLKTISKTIVPFLTRPGPNFLPSLPRRKTLQECSQYKKNLFLQSAGLATNNAEEIQHHLDLHLLCSSYAYLKLTELIL